MRETSSWRRVVCFLFHFWFYYRLSVGHPHAVNLETGAVRYYCRKCRRVRWVNA